MNSPSPFLRDLTTKVLSASRATSADPHVSFAVHVCDRLRASLAGFAGVHGFSSLLRRALALASADVPALQTARVGTDGRLQWAGQDEAPPSMGSQDAATNEAAVALTTHLLGLLVTFLGEPLTLRLVLQTSPDAAPDQPLPRNETNR